MQLVGLRKRPEFVHVATHGSKYAMPSLVLQACLRPDAAPNIVGVGFTATRTLGGAVIRNRVKRRLRAAVREIMPKAGTPGYNYVLIGRKRAFDCEYQTILRDLKTALHKLSSMPAMKAVKKDNDIKP